MPCLQSTYQYLNKRASSKLQQAVLWKFNLIRNHCQISGSGCAQSILPWQIALLRHWCPFATTYLCESGFSALTCMETKYRHRLCVGNDLRPILSPNTSQHCRVTVACESIHPPWHFSYFVALQHGIKIYFFSGGGCIIWFTQHAYQFEDEKICFIVKQTKKKTQFKKKTLACKTIPPTKVNTFKSHLLQQLQLQVFWGMSL